MFSYFLLQVKEDYSWYSKSKSPLHFIIAIFRQPYFQLLLIFRILTNFYRGVGKIMLFPLYKYYKILCWSCQIELPITVKLGKGAIFIHYGPRTFNDNAVIGEHCMFYPCVLIGGQRGKGTPVIGNHVFLGAGSKVIGKVIVNDFVFVCPNSVIVTDVEVDSVVSGIPAKVINKRGKENVSLYDIT